MSQWQIYYLDFDLDLDLDRDVSDVLQHIVKANMGSTAVDDVQQWTNKP